jgi:anti-sigma B factor antagonist
MRLHGHFGIDSSPALRDRLLPVLQASFQRVVTLDLADVSYIDTSGIATLLEAVKIARSCNVTFCVKGLQGRVFRLFTATGLLNLFEARGCGDTSSGSKVS